MSLWKDVDDGTEPKEEEKIPPPTDEFISFEETNHKNPYNNPFLWEAEDIFGYMLTYRRPFDRDIIDYLIEKRKKLHANVCYFCYRLPVNRKYQPMKDRTTVTIKRMDIEASKREGTAVTFEFYEKKFLECKGCRVLILKQFMNKEIKGDCSAACLFASPTRRGRLTLRTK